MYGFLPRPPVSAPEAGTLPPDLPGAGGGAPASGLRLAHDTIDSLGALVALAQPAADLVANGVLTKFFADLRGADGPRVSFMNANFTRNGGVPDAARYHWSFAREVFGIPEGLAEFNQVTYFTPGPKRYVAGVVHTYDLADREGPVVGLQFYPQDLIAEEALAEVLAAVAPRISIPDAPLAFVPTGAQQTTARIAADLAALGIEVLPLDVILGAITYIPLNLGEAWGTLRIFPADFDDVRPDDVVVLDELPLDLSVVAAVVTRAVQDTNSHVNLKSKERNTPNAVLRDAGPDHPRLAPFADQPVHLVVRSDDFLIEASTAEVVAQKLAERLGGPLVPLGWESATDLPTYAEMAKVAASDVLGLSRRYGAKATNLGFLAHPGVLGRADLPGTPSGELGYDLVPAGFAVPFQDYADFVNHPANAELRSMLDDLVADVQAGGLSPRELVARADGVRGAFLTACFPPGQLERLRARVEQVFPGVKKLKVRSSANAEDIPGFDGAGLHNSYSAKTRVRDAACQACRVEVEVEDDGEVNQQVDPRSLGCAVKGAYASLWNRRAIDERWFARIDQYSVAMGLGLVAAYDTESEVVANAVVITRVLNTDAVYGYSLSVQRDNNLVTNPNPGTHSEVTIAAFISDDEPVSFTTTRFARPVADSPPLTSPVLSVAAMTALVDLVRTVERAYCAAEPDYYPGDCSGVTSDNTKPRSLDLEVKVLADGRFVVKQVREFGGR